MGVVAGGVLMATGKIQRGSALPFGAFLAVSGVFILFLGREVWDFYRQVAGIGAA